MGNSIRVDTLNNANHREILNLSYDKTHGIEAEPSIWEHFSPFALGSAVLFPLVFNSKEFKHVNIAQNLSKQDIWRNKYRMIRLNELEYGLDMMKLKKTAINGKKVVDPFLNSDLLNLKHEINVTKNAGAMSKDALKQLNKKYFELADKSLTWKSPFQKAMIKAGKIFPNTAGEFAKAFKNNKAMLFFEAAFELGDVISAFTTPNPGEINTGLNIEAGTKQLVKSACRVGVGYTGFAAGTAAGLKIGALLGSVIPGAGTAIGGIIGSAIGFAVGGVVSQLAKSAFNNIVPDTKTVAKNTTVENILDETNKSEEAKIILEKEISDAQTYLEEAKASIESATKSGDEDAIKEASESKETVEKGYNAMVEIYKKKFGEQLVANVEKKPADTQTNQSQQQNQVTQQTASNYIPTQTGFNQNPLQYQMMPNGGIATDWSSMLPYQMQQNLFATKA